MLSTQDIAQHIAAPNSVDPSELNALKELSAKYPYTQLFSILYLKGLSDSGDVMFDDELQKHSYRIGDRTRLYDLIKSHEAKTSTEPSTIKEPKIAQTEIVEENPVIEDISETIDEIVEAKVEVSEAPETIEVEETVHTEERELEKVETTTEESDVDIETADAVEENILHHALAANYALEELNESELAELSERESKKQVEEESVELADTPTIEVHEKHTFTSWLRSNENYTEEVNEDKAAINAIVNDFSEFDPSEELFGEVEKPKKEFFSPVKKAKESLREDTLPVSETLAKIYIAQGNYPKAIDAYQQLSLIYPEKKIFFANLINDLKKKLNQ